jgi:hypothetical protein
VGREKSADEGCGQAPQQGSGPAPTDEARNGHAVLARYLFYPGRRAYETPTFRGCLRRRSYAYRTGWSALAPSLLRAHHSARPSRSRRTSVPPLPAPPPPRRPVPSACSACLAYAPLLSTLLAEARPAAVSSCAARPRAAQQPPSEWCASIAPLPGSRTRVNNGKKWDRSIATPALVSLGRHTVLRATSLP